MPTLTLQQSINGGLRSVQVRRSQKVELLRLRARVAELESAFPLKQVEEPKPNIPDMLKRTRDHIDAIDNLISKCKDAREMDALTRSKEREWKIYAHLAGIPGPGQLKPSETRRQPQRRMPSIVPPSVPQATPNGGVGDAQGPQGQQPV